jgi:hypothetical protein
LSELELEDDRNEIAQLRFLAHLKEFGIVYAVAYFVAQDLGILTKIATIAGGMC